MENPVIKRALVSVADKTGIVEFAQALARDFGVQIFSTGGTAALLRQAGVSVTPVEDVTGIPELMDGRVKTLHPRIHGGLLAKRDDEAHLAQAADNGIDLIDMVVANFAAFDEAVAADCDLASGIDGVDIGGTTLLRSAAKNHEWVTVVTNPAIYDDLLAEISANGGATTAATRRALALEAFRITGAYDTAIASWLASQMGSSDRFPHKLDMQFTKVQDLRYGENPSQSAALYACPGASAHCITHAEQLNGRPLSYNNVLDADVCWTIVREFAAPAAVVLKHQNPCGSAEAETVERAFELACACDVKSAVGSVIGVNRTVSAEIVQRILDLKLYVEVLVAPSFEAEALELLKEKPQMRVLATGGSEARGREVEFRSVDGGVLVQDADVVPEDPAVYEVVTNRKPSDPEMEDLLFAWKVVKGARSNAILIAKDRVGIGLGAGQPNSVDSCEIACSRAGEACKASVAASDAFFPFRDNVDVLARHGITAIIQPGGSIRDEESIAACNEHGIAMVFTGHRHFRH